MCLSQKKRPDKINICRWTAINLAKRKQPSRQTVSLLSYTLHMLAAFITFVGLINIDCTMYRYNLFCLGATPSRGFIRTSLIMADGYTSTGVVAKLFQQISICSLSIELIIIYFLVSKLRHSLIFTYYAFV